MKRNDGARSKSKVVDADDKQRQVGIRMSDSLKTKIGTYQQRVRKETGISIGFATAVRTLIERGLEASR